jgi:hypothetical protein
MDIGASPQEDSMSFNARDLMIDVLPADKFNPLAQPGFALCGQATATAKGDEEDDEEEDDLECGQATAATTNPPSYAPRTEGLALLRRQLREALSA